MPHATGKKAAEKNAYIGTLAEQLINGVNNMVIFLSRSEESVRLAITLGTEHPNPNQHWHNTSS